MLLAPSASSTRPATPRPSCWRPSASCWRSPSSARRGRRPGGRADRRGRARRQARAVGRAGGDGARPARLGRRGAGGAGPRRLGQDLRPRAGAGGLAGRGPPGDRRSAVGPGGPGAAGRIGDPLGHPGAAACRRRRSCALAASCHERRCARRGGHGGHARPGRSSPATPRRPAPSWCWWATTPSCPRSPPEDRSGPSPRASARSSWPTTGARSLTGSARRCWTSAQGRAHEAVAAYAEPRAHPGGRRSPSRPARPWLPTGWPPTGPARTP